MRVKPVLLPCLKVVWPEVQTHSIPPHNEQVTRTALIVGAGIGGLSAAIALRRAGWNVRIFERAASPRELGFGLGLAPNGIRALYELGVGDTVLTRGFSPQIARGEVRRIDGTVLKRAEFPMREGLGGPYVMALRPALHGALMEAVGIDTITAASEATGVSVRGDRALLELANGQRVEGDLLVGADGMWSATRRALHPSEASPRSSGVLAIRGAVDGAHRHLGGLAGVYYLGPGVESMIIRASETGIYWFLSLARELIPDGLRDPAAILNHMLPRMDATFRAVTSATQEMRCDELFDRDPIPWWGQGVVTLLGDAAHPVLPHTGQGAAQAIVDAVTLGKAVAADSNLERALRAYEAERRPKTAALLAQGRRTARIMRTMNPVAVHARELVIRSIPVTSLVKFIAKINRRAGTDVMHAR